MPNLKVNKKSLLDSFACFPLLSILRSDERLSSVLIVLVSVYISVQDRDPGISGVPGLPRREFIPGLGLQSRDPGVFFFWLEIAPWCLNIT